MPPTAPQSVKGTTLLPLLFSSALLLLFFPYSFLLDAAHLFLLGFDTFLVRKVTSQCSATLLLLGVGFEFSILPQSLNAYFSTFLFSMLTRTLQRKYMFLLCNAILDFLTSKSLYDAPLVQGECYYEQVSSLELLLANQDYELLLAETEQGKEHKEGGEGKGINSKGEAVKVELEDATKEE
ncbi:hypothetical protein Ahy_B04g072770 [Arachis hypogaea]|uniref:Uncharacterized protein n=1 Tax=Arachis hypogaea TaxID=3818 RepID=A0A444ZNR3_ARAHY|nr:hypothetical protein Ahy_B04g072770 [Arachis hypogaea]